MRRMRLIRCLQGKTLDYVADCVHLSKRYVQGFENGRFNLKLEHKQRIADLLGVEIKELSVRISEEDKKKYFNSNGTFRGFKAIKKEKEREKEKIKLNIIKVCHNQACLLNKECFCDNDVVKENRGTCDGQYKVAGPPTALKNQIAFGKIIEGERL